jgi:methylglutaconyl-CoA hydratase
VKSAMDQQQAYRHLQLRREGPVEHVALDRPEVRNAFNPALVDDLYAWARSIDDRPDLRAAVLSGAGPVFCAGGDLAGMAALVHATREDNLADAQRMAAMFDALDRLAVPLIGRVHGAALGGGAGLASVCDIVVAADDAMFAFSEVKLGIVPSVISPYVLARVGQAAARELFLTGARFGAARAKEIGLVHAVVPAAELDAAVGRYLAEILSAGPEAVRAAKRLIRDVWGRPPADAAELTVSVLADRRVSAEGQEGLRAFLEKRRPGWVPR